MTLLSLDQSSRITGWAIFEDNKLVKYGAIDLKDENLGTRLSQLRQQIRGIVNTYKIDEVVFEDIQLQGNISNNVQTFKALACVYGIIEELLTELNISHKVIASSTWKSNLGIKGKTRAEQKQNAAEYVKTNYHVNDIQDIADAICIGASTFTDMKKSAWD